MGYLFIYELFWILFVSRWNLLGARRIKNFSEKCHYFNLLVDQFIYVGSNISSTEGDVNIYIGKAWTAFDQKYGILVSLIR